MSNLYLRTYKVGIENLLLIILCKCETYSHMMLKREKTQVEKVDRYTNETNVGWKT